MVGGDWPCAKEPNKTKPRVLSKIQKGERHSAIIKKKWIDSIGTVLIDNAT